ncbi:MAG: class I SAM-dependent methyltransferase [Candidatus Aminicenantes bacterium]|jgi:demethylmenaquinone methyltransferase/2-methoxy-6-polyprenyl-1,4-benzoquinol methylase
MTDMNSYIKKLEEAHPLREDILHSAIAELKLLPGSRGLDAGCGIGQPAMLLAEAVGPDGHVTGLDISPELLAHGGKIVETAGLTERISFHKGSVNNLPFEENSFDFVWSSDCVGYPVGELLPLLKELGRVTKPAGTVAILAWSSQQLLPGFPLLEARLNAQSSSYLPYVKEAKPESNFVRALGWFRRAGFVSSTAKTFIGDVYAPLTEDIRTALVAFFEMLWGEPQPGESPEDRAEYLRLCSPDSADFILDCPDYYAFFTCSMFWGKIPE